MRAEQLTPVVTHHGEGPVWSPRWRGPRWVDMLAGDVCELQPDGSIDRNHVDTVAAMIRPRRHGGHVIAGERRLLLSADDDLHAELNRGDAFLPGNDVRLNEGGCDPAGHLYLGSMAYDSRPDGGQLYRIGPDLRPAVVEAAVTVSNGIDWSPDGSTCYYVDSPTRRVDRADWTAEGLSGRRSFVEIDGPGTPDGLTVDALGQVWVAIYGGGRVCGYSASGELIVVIELPVAQVTAVAFFGPVLDELLITTSREGLGNQAEPAAGALFTAIPGASGQPIRPFAG